MQRKRLNFFYKILMFTVAALITVFILPHSNKFKYEFQKGEPWKHKSLIAEFDFPVYKSDETIKAEKESILKLAKPYYIFNLTVYKSIDNEVDNDIKGLFSELTVSEKNRKEFTAFTDSFINGFKQKIKSIYEKGIIQPLPENYTVNSDNNEIYVLKNNVAELTKYSDFYSSKQSDRKSVV